MGGVFSNVFSKALGPIGSVGMALGSLGGAFSGLSALAMGPMGVITAALGGLVSLVDENNEDVQALKEYWTAAIEPIKELVTGAVASFTGWIKNTIEMAKSSQFFIGVLGNLKAFWVEVFETGATAVDRAVEVFHQFQAAATETLTGAKILLGQIGEAILVTFGMKGMSAVTDWGKAIKEWVVDKLELAAIVIRNWPEFFEIARKEIVTKFINIGEAMATLPTNAVIIGEYIRNNWSKLILDGINAVMAGFQNMGSYLGELGYAIVQFFKDPSKGFKMPEWKGLLEGFKATADKFPELISASFSKADISAELAKIAANEANLKKHEREKKAAEEAAEASAAKAEGSPFKREILGVADLRSKIMEGIFGGKDDTAKKTLAAAERTAKATEKMADEEEGPAEYAP